MNDNNKSNGFSNENSNGQYKIQYGFKKCSWTDCNMIIHQHRIYCDWCSRFALSDRKRDRYNYHEFLLWRNACRSNYPKTAEYTALFVDDGLVWETIKGAESEQVLQEELINLERKLYIQIESLADDEYVKAIWQHNQARLQEVLASRNGHAVIADGHISKAIDQVENDLPF